jgi:drug/metabolite transporter (DMT)-like permease
MVVAFLLSRGGGAISTDDLLLLAAVVVASIGYAESGRLSKTMPGWQVICWAVIFALPVTLPIATYSAFDGRFHPGGAALLGFLYVSLVSMLFGFFAWNRGMATAGIARASQVQLAQPLLTLGWAALFFGEPISVTMLGVAAGVIVCVATTQRVRIGTANRRTKGWQVDIDGVVDGSPHELAHRSRPS